MLFVLESHSQSLLVFVGVSIIAVVVFLRSVSLLVTVVVVVDDDDVIFIIDETCYNMILNVRRWDLNPRPSLI